jgi:hypothetical protein
MATRKRTRFSVAPTPPPPPPTPEERALALAEANAALLDAFEAVLHVRVELDEMRRQQALVQSLRSDLARFVDEKRQLEERLRLIVQEMPSRNARAAHQHAQRMRRAALYWEQQAVALGHRGRNSPAHHIPSYAKYF